MSGPSYRQLVRDARGDIAGGTSYTVWSVLAALAGLALGLSIGLRYGATAALSGAMAGTALGLLLVIVVTEALARRRATERYFRVWGADRGWAFEASPPVYSDTPLLRAGDRQFADRGFVGKILGHHGCVYQHTRRDESSSSGSRGGPATSVNDRHYVVARIELPLQGIERLLLHPRGFLEIHLFDTIESRLGANEVVELESAEFNDTYRLQVARGTDPALVRELFTPDAIVSLLDLEGGEAFEYGLFLEAEHGVVVFAAQGRVDVGTLNFVDDMLARAQPFAEWLSAFSAAHSAV
jgi:hypothetical protein